MEFLMRRFFQKNSLSLILFVLFAVFLVGQSITGFLHYNDEQQTHQQPEVTYTRFVTSGDFIETVFENWQSEFLAVFSIVILSIFLRQRGSPESKSVNSPHFETGS